MGGEVSTDFKSSNRIEISRLVQVLLNFDWFQGSPTLGGRGWVDGGWGWWQGPPTYVHTHAHARMCMHIWHHRESLGFPQIQWGQPFAWNYHVYHACMCVHVHVCACLHMRACAHVWGHPPTTPTPIHPAPHPQSRREPKTPKFNKSWTNRDNSILFEDSLPLNIPQLIWTIADHSRHPPTHLPHPPEPRKPKLQELQ